MLLRTKGKPHGIIGPIVGRVTRNLEASGDSLILVLDEGRRPTSTSSFKAVLSSLEEAVGDRPAVRAVETFDHLADGDIVVVHPNGAINTLWRVNSHYNFLLATERCNSNCLMCSQPPKDRDDIPFLLELHKQLIPLIPKSTAEVGITGGEPTLLGAAFFELLELIQTELPETEVHCLTNGRSFAWSRMTGALDRLGFTRLMLGIPLYSDNYYAHDYIVQARGAFNQTMLGLYNLAGVGQRIEIRVVLHKQTIPRLKKLSRFIYQNLPFVEHVTFMGLENQGYTPFNIEKLWIDPVEYMDDLGEAVQFLAARGMNVSVYNSQLCVMPESLWPFSKKSISDWKNVFLDICGTCGMRNACGGLFTSGAGLHSRAIRPFPIQEAT